MFQFDPKWLRLTGSYLTVVTFPLHNRTLVVIWWIGQVMPPMFYVFEIKRTYARNRAWLMIKLLLAALSGLVLRLQFTIYNHRLK